MILLICLIIAVSYSVNAEETLSTPKIGLALSGGGARGFAHIGVLKVIDELGIKIDYISGTSIGALIGGLYAIGYSGAEIEEIFINLDWEAIIDDSVPRKDYYIGEKRWKEYYNVSFVLDDKYIPSLPQGFVSGHKLINYLFEKTYPYSHISDFNQLPIPFSCIATDLLTGEMIVYNSGSLHEAIRSSVSLPSLLEPFYYKDRLTIDGGIKMNLPASVVKEMGADIVIGVKVTSDLRNIERLSSPITVLDQTINISTSEQRFQAIEECHLLIKPDLKHLTSTDYTKVVEIIETGVRAATKTLVGQFPELTTKEERLPSQPTTEPLPAIISFSDISVVGNETLSSGKIREYTNLTTNHPMSEEELRKGINEAYRTNLFSQIYPIIKPSSNPEQSNDYELTLRAIEKQRNRIGLNIIYNEDDDITFGTILEMKNQFGRNSILLSSLRLGGPREFLTDYVKNYGREWGAYFRLFSYVNEHSFYVYENHQRQSRGRSLEYGLCLGTGGFFFDKVIVEPYLYSYHKKLYQLVPYVDIDRKFLSSGAGIKLFLDTLDDTMFAMNGSELLMKYSYADENLLSDFSYAKFYGRLQQMLPLFSNESDYSASLKFKFEYGSYIGGNEVEYDPFYIGGMDSFIGLKQREKSAPIIKVASFTLRNHFHRNLFVDVSCNLANLSDLDYWDIDSDTYMGAGVVVGYRTLFFPVRMGIGIDSAKNLNSYISIGYDFDPFELSRR